jgi:hypothetical protein
MKTENDIVELSLPSKDVPYLVNIAVEDVNDHLDMLKVLRAFQAERYPATCRHAICIIPVHGDWISCHYDVKLQVLHVHYQGHHDAMPPLTWVVTEDQIRRTVLESGQARAKVWTPYRDNKFQAVWEVTYNEHSRDPLHLRKGMIPANMQNLVRELSSQIRSNKVLTQRQRNAFLGALGEWEESEARPRHSLFSEAEIKSIWDYGPVLQFTHQASWNNLEMVIKLLDGLSKKQPSFKDFLDGNHAE